jgi:hypothetical protein
MLIARQQPPLHTINEPDLTMPNNFGYGSNGTFTNTTNGTTTTTGASSISKSFKKKKGRKQKFFISEQELSKYYQYSQPEAARLLGISVSTLKRRYYKMHPNKRWPYNCGSSKNCEVQQSSDDNTMEDNVRSSAGDSDSCSSACDPGDVHHYTGEGTSLSNAKSYEFNQYIPFKKILSRRAIEESGQFQREYLPKMGGSPMSAIGSKYSSNIYPMEHPIPVPAAQLPKQGKPNVPQVRNSSANDPMNLQRIVNARNAASNVYIDMHTFVALNDAFSMSTHRKAIEMNTNSINNLF